MRYLGYMNMKPPVYESVIRDCDSALELDNKYIKSLLRRANALEQLEKFEDALRGECFKWSRFEALISQ